MKLDILFHYNVDEQTGEITYIGKEEIKVDTIKVPVVQDGEPKLYLEENKCKLSTAACGLLGIGAGDKIEIEYTEQNGGTVPVISLNKGNKLTKSLTIAYRGNKNKELAKYGSEFTIISKGGLFVLDSGVAVKPEVKDENLEVPEDINLEELNLDDLADTEDANVNSIDSNFFKL